MSQTLSPLPPPPPPPAPAENAQPTVRVMRLYKPCMHIVPTVPQLRPHADADRSKTGPDFAISQFLLLPDSFGDIYLGEVFSAYISVVNGLQEFNFYQIALAVRLQTANATHDLYDSRAMKGEKAVGQARTLLPNESVDMVVQHTLSELGTHTLRVTVNYLDNKTNELKPLRKFYRFNVLNPLEIRTVCTDIGHAYVIQCQVTNITKSILYIDEIKIVPSLKDMEFVQVQSPRPSSSSPTSVDAALELLDPEFMPMLMTEESYAYSFIVTKPAPGHLTPGASIGTPEVKWCSCMGEHSYIRGDEILASAASISASGTTPRPPASSTTSLPQGQAPDTRGVRVQCVKSPSEAIVGELFEVVIRVINDTGRQVSVQLQSRDGGVGNEKGVQTPALSSPNDLGLCVSGLSTQNLGLLEVAEYKDVTLTVFPLQSGLQALRSIVAIDASNNKEYAAGTLFKVMVYEDEERGSVLGSRYAEDEIGKLNCILAFDAY